MRCVAPTESKSTPVTRLNLGAGHSKLSGFVNIDLSPRADLHLELGKDPLPFPTSSIDEVFCYHTLEHIKNYLGIVGEIYRVLKPGGWLLVGVPYVTLTEHHLVNPYHLHNFNEFSFDYFDPSKLCGTSAEECEIHFEKVFHRFHYFAGFQRLPGSLQKWARRHLFNVVDKIDFGLVAIKDRVSKEPIKPEVMVARFDSLLDSREFYDSKVKENILRSRRATPSTYER